MLPVYELYINGIFYFQLLSYILSSCAIQKNTDSFSASIPLPNQTMLSYLPASLLANSQMTWADGTENPSSDEKTQSLASPVSAGGHGAEGQETGCQGGRGRDCSCPGPLSPARPLVVT